MRIFLSHASEQTGIAETIALALGGEGHVVFFDRSTLPSGEAYNERIREAIEGSDLFIFLVSPEAVSKGRYTITELEFARAQWSHPSNHVLPVVVRPTDLASVPAYLKAVTLLEPEGNLAAAVAAAVGRMANPRSRRLVRQWAPLLAVVLLIGLGFLARSIVGQRRLAAEVATILGAARLEHTAQNYSAAWTSYERAASLDPQNADIAREQERLAMDWLENIRVTAGQDTFTAIVEKVEPVLSRCAGQSDTTRAGDCLAHLGWADFLRAREGAGGLDPIQHYRRALERDPQNAYAEAMWGFEVLRARGTVAGARDHFDKAIASGRVHGYVRSLQLAGLLWNQDAQAEDEAIRVANEMREKAEHFSADASNPSGLHAGRLWSIYYDRVFRRNAIQQFLSTLSPADHLATFLWLSDETGNPADKAELKAFLLGALQENAGQRAEALATFRALRDVLARNGGLSSGGPLPDQTVAAVKRLSR